MLVLCAEMRATAYGFTCSSREPLERMFRIVGTATSWNTLWLRSRHGRNDARRQGCRDARRQGGKEAGMKGCKDASVHSGERNTLAVNAPERA